MADRARESTLRAVRPRGEGGVWGSYVQYVKDLEAQLVALERVVDAIPTPAQLEWIAKWLDLTGDTVTELLVDAAKTANYSEKDVAALEATKGNEMQSDIRRLAAILHESQVSDQPNREET